MRTSNQRGLLGLSMGAFCLGAAVTLFGAVEIYQTAQLPAGDGTGMQWIILTPLALLFLLVGLPALITGVRGLRRWRSRAETGMDGVIPWRGWQIAVGLLLLYLLAPFVVAPVLGFFWGE